MRHGTNQVARRAHPVFAATAARIDAWRARSDVLGVLHVGSRSRGHGDERSDDDLEVVLTEESFALLEPVACSEVLIEGEGPSRRIVWDAQYLPLSDLERKAGSTLDIDHWPYESAPVLFERDARVGAAVAAAAAMSPTFRLARLRHAVLDTWIACHRALKTRDRGAPIAARVLVGRAARALTRVVFALEHRWTPLDHWLEAELRTLADPTGAIPLLLEGIASADPAPLKEAIEGLGKALAAERIPTDLPGRQALFLELMHPRCFEERTTHALR